MIQPASEIKISTNLDRISEGIQKAAKEGWHYLSLYKTTNHDIGWNKQRIFQYNERDLDELRKLGYKVNLDDTEVFNSGFFWWKRKIGQIDYHTISW